MTEEDDGVGDDDGDIDDIDITGQTTMQMWRLTAMDSGWEENNWRFGSNEQYPALRAKLQSGMIGALLPSQPCPRQECQ